MLYFCQHRKEIASDLTALLRNEVARREPLTPRVLNQRRCHGVENDRADHLRAQNKQSNDVQFYPNGRHLVEIHCGQAGAQAAHLQVVVENAEAEDVAHTGERKYSLCAAWGMGGAEITYRVETPCCRVVADEDRRLSLAKEKQPLLTEQLNLPQNACK